MKKNEERTATGIVVGRNIDETGTLAIYNIDTGTRVNRCKTKLVRQPSGALRAQIKALAVLREVVDDDLVIPGTRLTQSTRPLHRSDAPLATSDLPDTMPQSQETAGVNKTMHRAK